jgi:two-component system osmolarity sensor histidine kinase EnvZ
MDWFAAMSKLRRSHWRFLPKSLYARLFAVQSLVLLCATALVIVLFAATQAQNSMSHVADIWTPALREATKATVAVSQEDITVSREITIVYGAPPTDAYVPHRTHLRWHALQSAIRERGFEVTKLAVSGLTGDVIVWFALDEPASKWIGVRSNLEGEDFRWRWLAALLATLAVIALASYWVGKRIVTPLRKLEAAVIEYSAGKPFVAPRAAGSPEIDTLVQAFNHMTAEREDLDSQRALMLAGISHDIRSPLGRIRMAAELLETNGSNEALAKRIVRNVAVANDLIESFSDYVRAESEALDELIDINSLLLDEITRQGLGETALVRSEAVRVRGNARLLQRAFANVIDNAQKHGRPPITVATERTANNVRIVIDDCGAGIAEGDRERLLRPFERGDPSRNTQGTGLGLAIALRVMRRHGGDLIIDRAPSGGTRCVLTLPIALQHDTE